MQSILLITGPTAIGKSAYALEKAQELNGEVISADSMQVYRHMDIGTAKPSVEDRKKVPHHLIDIVDPNEPFSVADFVERFKVAKAEIEGQGRVPIVVGGTGLYLNALLKGFKFPVLPPQPEIREQLKAEAKERGGEVLYEKLQELDPVSAQRLHPNDQFRVIRALEVALATGKPLSAQQAKGSPILGSDHRLVCLTADRAVIYERINQRVDRMFAQGLVEEVQKLLAMGYNKNLMALQALGYKETIEHLEGKGNKAELIELVKQKTRNFAKRQMTWFRSFENVEWVEVN